MKILVLNGPNINMLGQREKTIYGSESYNDMLTLIKNYSIDHNLTIDCFQSNHEGVLIDKIQASLNDYDGLVFNPAGYTHTSIALYDALMAVGLPCVEVHISNVDSREDFRQINYIKPACIASVKNEGIMGYISGIKVLESWLK